jgi:hypothetical protein
VKRTRWIDVGDVVNGRDVVGSAVDHLSLRCTCGSVSTIARRNATHAGRCRGCGYANMKRMRAENAVSADFAAVAARIRICREVVVSMGTAGDSPDMDDPVIETVRARFARNALGDVPFSLLECGIILGMTKAGVAAIEARALSKLRRRLMSNRELVDTLRERDSGRDAFTYVRGVMQ